MKRPKFRRLIHSEQNFTNWSLLMPIREYLKPLWTKRFGADRAPSCNQWELNVQNYFSSLSYVFKAVWSGNGDLTDTRMWYCCCSWGTPCMKCSLKGHCQFRDPGRLKILNCPSKIFAWLGANWACCSNKKFKFDKAKRLVTGRLQA